jgi:hypothetical protein
LTLHAKAALARIGARVGVRGVRLHDGTIRVSQLRVLGRVHRVTIHGVVVRQLRSRTLVATGGSTIAVHHTPIRLVASARDHGGLSAGEVADFQVRIGDDDELVEAAPPTPLGQTANVQVEGKVVSVSPLVVSLEGLPVTVTVPSGTTLPAGLAAGERIELTVTVGDGNVFTLVSVDEIEGAAQQTAGEEVEVRGLVVGSTASQLVVSSGGATFTFAAPAGVTLPTLAPGTSVEVRGVQVNGVLTLERLKLLDEGDSGGGSGDDGGGHDGGGGDGGGHGGDGG